MLAWLFAAETGVVIYREVIRVIIKIKKQSTKYLREEREVIVKIKSELMKVAAVSSYSIIVDATLVSLRIVLTIILEGILLLQPEPEIGLGLAHLFHLVPCYLALV